jgi:CspA family cold shock protein
LSTSRVSQHTISRGQTATATVKWFSDQKGFVSITPDDQGKDLFVRQTGVAGGGSRSLAEDAKVSYGATRRARGTERRERADDLTRSGYSYLGIARLKRAVARQDAKDPGSPGRASRLGV